ncbi:MAG: 6-pyruvoyl tetrahydrobiopterin synthase [Candidatus Solibacter sp.]|nr:6-pyruvoyl tetrahydrobiopterin synthase [Candidatus Solibacter sp.]
MPAVRLTRRYRFSSSHRLHAPVLSDEENRRIYGKCNNPYGHGHDYLLEVTVEGEADARTGRVLPLALLDGLVRRVVIEPMDRRDLNTEIDEFAALAPTTENLAVVAARRISEAWPHVLPGVAARLDKIRIHETRNNIFEISAADPAVRQGSEAAEQRQRVKT